MVEQSTKIIHLLQMDIGQGTGGYMLSVKTFKKKWQQGKVWWQQCICMDETGEILVEVKLRGNIKLAREFKCVVGTIHELDWQNTIRKGLTVFEYIEPTQTPDEWMEQEDIKWQGHIDEIRGKIRHGLSCALIPLCAQDENIAPSQPIKDGINEWVEFIIKGE